MYGCKSWTVKKAEHRRIDCFWTVVLEKTPASPLDCKEIQPVHSEGDQPWDFFGRNDAKAESPVLWPPHVKSWLIGKDSDAGRDWGQEEKRTTEDEMAGWHHWLDGRESEWTPGVGAGQGGLACCNSWGRKELDTTEQLIWSEVYSHLLGCREKVLAIGTGMKTDLFQSYGHCWVFQICWHIECSTFTASSFRILNGSAEILPPALALFIVMLLKAHLTSHSRMSCSRWGTTPLWSSGSSWLWPACSLEKTLSAFSLLHFVL